MASLYLYNGELLIVGGALAANVACCCESTGCENDLLVIISGTEEWDGSYLLSYIGSCGWALYDIINPCTGFPTAQITASLVCDVPCYDDESELLHSSGKLYQILLNDTGVGVIFQKAVCDLETDCSNSQTLEVQDGWASDCGSFTESTASFTLSNNNCCSCCGTYECCQLEDWPTLLMDVSCPEFTEIDNIDLPYNEVGVQPITNELTWNIPLHEDCGLDLTFTLECVSGNKFRATICMPNISLDCVSTDSLGFPFDARDTDFNIEFAEITCSPFRMEIKAILNVQGFMHSVCNAQYPTSGQIFHLNISLHT